MFRHTRKSKLENQWQGPYIISKKLTEVTYQVDLDTFGKKYLTFHVNCMRKWTSPTPAAFMALDHEDLNHEKEDTHIMQTSHQMELEKLKSLFKDVLQDVPGRTTLVHHKIPTQDAPSIHSATWAEHVHHLTVTMQLHSWAVCILCRGPVSTPYSASHTLNRVINNKFQFIQSFLS